MSLPNPLSSKRVPSLCRRVIVLLLGTTLLAMAVLDAGLLHHMRDWLFGLDATDKGDHAPAATWTRVVAGAAALAMLAVRGAWADVALGLTLVLAFAGVAQSYNQAEDRASKPATMPVEPTPLRPGDIRLSVSKVKVTPPSAAIAKDANSRLAAVVTERDLDAKVTRTLTRIYAVTLRTPIAAETVADDVLVDYHPSSDLDLGAFVADLRFASTLYVLPAAE